MERSRGRSTSKNNPTNTTSQSTAPNTPLLGQFFNSRVRSPDKIQNSHKKSVPSQNFNQNNHNNYQRQSSRPDRSHSANRYNNEFILHNGFDLPAKGKTGKFKQKQQLAIAKRTDVQPPQQSLWKKPQLPYANIQPQIKPTQKTSQINNTPSTKPQNITTTTTPQYKYMQNRYPIEIKSHIFIEFKKSELLTWCDACTGLIWPMLGSTCAKCKNCSITVHHRCLELLNTSQLPICPNRPVKLKPKNNAHTHHGKTPVIQKKIINTPSPPPSLPQPQILSWNEQPKIKNTSTIRKLFPTPNDLHNAITEYNEIRSKMIPTKNSSKNSNLKMSLHDDKTTFRGYIRVTVELQRPVKITNSTNNNASNPSFSLKKFDSFSKNLHLTSQTTAYDVIEALLKRYKIIDHMKKFALYQRIQKTACHHIVERLEYNCKPLVLRLYHGRTGNVVKKESKEVILSSGVKEGHMNEPHQFLLKEADVAGIQWDQFNQNELISFLTIIDIEENKTKNEIRAVFNKFRENLIKSL